MSVQSVALASLTATYTDSEGEDGVEDERLQEENSNTPQGAAPHNAQVGCQPQARSISPISGRSASHSPVVGKFGSSDLPDASTKVQRLVSYFDDAVVSDDEGAAVALPAPLLTTASATVAERTEENGLFPAAAAAAVVAATATVAAGAERRSPTSRPGELLSDGVEAGDTCGVTIPPEPAVPCPPELQEKIAILCRKMESGGLDMNLLIQQRKDFRNPSIYEKLIQFCSINELGTNYPPDRFDPFKWGKDSYYEELAKVQKAEMDKLDKARKEKTKIEIVSGTAKRPNSSSGGAEDDAKKRKSKWDQVATGGSAAAAAVAAAAAAAATGKPTVLLTQPTLTTFTSSSATKPTVISAFGSLPKKRL
ncbi:PREDICTED: SAP30-binding protein isoform X2 [Dinoponera quadriceps]|uniref:SAP30-binding protein isoform X2 n=1 Tax=Dinoponera quadriceps TaxID=609295 RepID=A0A6P3XV04_DINQU|nr:PREDICTED: SAP30-binding protein isoform X2 [Dinoponera quadriceps]